MLRVANRLMFVEDMVIFWDLPRILEQDRLEVKI
jgi:hypothetical protein